MLSGLFKRPSSQLYCIELDDHKIDIELSKLIKQIEQRIAEFKAQLNENSLQIKEDLLVQLREQIIPCKRDIQQIAADINKITSIEKEHANHLFIKDEQFLIDKQQQLRTLHQLVENISQIFEQRPNMTALQEGLFQELQKEIYASEQAINKMLSDDEQLQLIYHSLTQM